MSAIDFSHKITPRGVFLAKIVKNYFEINTPLIACLAILDIKMEVDLEKPSFSTKITSIEPVSEVDVV
jgi:hypothetical protein